MIIPKSSRDACFDQLCPARDASGNVLFQFNRTTCVEAKSTIGLGLQHRSLQLN